MFIDVRFTLLIRRFCVLNHNVRFSEEVRIILAYTAEFIADLIDARDEVLESGSSEISRAAERLADLCTVCAERLAHHNCDACDRRVCKACMVASDILPLSCFCSIECRDEAELAAEEVRQSDAYVRWN